MPKALAPILKTILFTILVPGFVALRVPYDLLGQQYRPNHGPLAGLGILVFIVGAGIYFACAWEFAVRGLGTPAPIAPTKFLVVSGLHRYVRNPMYVGVLLVILGQAAFFALLGWPHTGLCAFSSPICSLFFTKNPRCADSSENPTNNIAVASHAGFHVFGGEYRHDRRPLPIELCSARLKLRPSNSLALTTCRLCCCFGQVRS